MQHLTGLAGRDIYFQLIIPSVTNGIFITCNTLDFSDHDPVYDKLMIRINGSNGFKIGTHFLRQITAATNKFFKCIIFLYKVQIIHIIMIKGFDLP